MMAKLTMGKDTPAVAALVVDRVYRITPPADCTIGIGPEAGGRVAHDHRYAQLRGGVTYEFFTSSVDTNLTVLSKRDAGNLDYIDSRAKPVAVAAADLGDTK